MGKKKNQNKIKIAGQTFDVGRSLNARDLRKIEKKVDNFSPALLGRAVEKAENKGITVKKSAQDFLNTYTQPGSSTVDEGGITEDTRSYDLNNFSSPGVAAPGTLSAPEYQAFLANLPEIGAYERQKLMKESALEVTKEEQKGKLDLQKIINAGYKNIANIERGSNMFSSIMGAFNF